MAAVIRRTVTAVNKRIGVNNFDTGADEIGRAIAEAGDTIRRTAFKIDAEKAEKIGMDRAMAIESENIRKLDESGNPVALEAPEGYGRIARQAYQRVIERRFVETIDKDIRVKAQELAIKHDRNPLEFSKAMDAYIGGLTNKQDTKFNQQIIEMGAIAKEQTHLRLVEAARNRARANAAQHVIAQNLESTNLAIQKARQNDIAGALDIESERFSATGDAEGAGLKIGSASQFRDNFRGQVAGANLASNFPTLSRSDRNQIVSAISSGGVNVTLSKEAKQVYDRVSNLITPSNQDTVLAEIRSSNSALISQEDFELRQQRIINQKAVSDLLTTLPSTDFALGKSYIEESQKAINTPQEFDKFFGGAWYQFQARQDQFMNMAKPDANGEQALSTEAALRFSEDAKMQFMEPWLLNAAAQGNQDQLKSYILNGTHDGSLNSYQIQTIDSLKKYDLLSATDVETPAIKTLLNTDIGKLQDRQSEMREKVELTNSAVELAASLERGFVVDEFGTSLEERFSDNLSKSSLDVGEQQLLMNSIKAASLRGQISGWASGLSSGELEDVSRYIESGGQTELPMGRARTVGEKILAVGNQDLIENGKTHIEALRTGAARLEAENAAEVKYQDNLQSILEGRRDPNEADARKVVDEFLKRTGVDIYNQETWTPESIAVMSRVPPQSLVDALNIMTSTGQSRNADSVLSLYRTLRNFTGYGSPKDSLGDSLGGFSASETKKALLDEMIDGIDAGIYANTQEAMNVMMARREKASSQNLQDTFGKTKEDRAKAFESILNTAVGAKNRDAFIDSEFTSLAEQLALLGYKQTEITTKLTSIFNRDYGNAVAVVDFNRPLEGRNVTRLSLETLTANGEDVNDIYNVINGELSSLGAMLYDTSRSFPLNQFEKNDPRSLTVSSMKWYEDPRFEGKSMVVLSPAPDATKRNPKFLTYQVVRRDDAFLLEPFIVGEGANAIWPSFQINEEMAYSRGIRAVNEAQLQQAQILEQNEQKIMRDENERIRQQQGNPRSSGLSIPPRR